MNNKSLLLLTIGLGLTLAAVWLLALAGFGVPEVRAASFTVCSAGCDYSVIQDAVDAASDGDVIKVAAGTYTDINHRGGLAQVVYIVKSITIQGGYTTAFTEPPDPEANPTTLDAGGQGRVIYIEGDINPTIAGLRITGGEAKNLGSPIGIDAGGGVLIVSASATLKGNYIYENSADSTHNGDGGGVYLLDSDATLESNTIISNTAQREGGGIRTHNSPATLAGNTISVNYAGERGDGLFLGFSPATVDGNIISENYGRGIFVDQSAATLNNNIIISNTWGGLFLWECDNARVTGNTISHNTLGGNGNGAGIWSNGDSVTIQGNIISHNTADWFAGASIGGENVRFIGNTISFNTAVNDGGGVSFGGTGDLNGNTFISNTAGGGGGGLHVDAPSGEISIAGNTFIGNTADSGGGLGLSGEGHQLINNLIVDNHATNCCGSGLHIAGATSLRLLHNTIARNTGGGGIGLSILGNSTVAMTNTILVSQTMGIDVQTGSTTTLAATLWGNGAWANSTDWSGGGTINRSHDYWGDPDFVNYLAGDYHIGENSDAIDAGIEAGVTTDIDNHPRPYQIPDLGADEYWPPGTLKFIYLPLVIK